MTKAHELAEFLKKVEACGPRPCPCTSIMVDEEGMTIEVSIDNTVSRYLEWIKGEGADIGLYRDQEHPNRVVGIRLPLKHLDVHMEYLRKP